MINLHLTVAVVFYAITVLAQSETKSLNSKFRIGFNLGTNHSWLYSKESLPDNAVINTGIGARLGILMDYSLSKNFIFSPKVELAFNKSEVDLKNNDNSVSTYRIFPISLEVLSHFVYKAGEGNSKPYFLIGPNLRVPIRNNSKSSTAFENRSDVAIDVGLGLENSFKYFLFSPELRYSFGLLNVSKHPTLNSLKFHALSLVLNFK